MLQFDTSKIVMILFLTFSGILYAMPNALSPAGQQWLQETLPSWLPTSTVSLGLDLQGGSHLLLEADIDIVMKEHLESMVETARTEMRKKKIGYLHLQAGKDNISFKLRDPEKHRKAVYKIARGLEENATVKVEDDGQVNVVLGPVGVKAIETQVINRSIEIVRRRVDELGTKEPIIQRQGTNRIVLQVPGVENPDELKKIIGKTAKMSFHLLDDDAMISGKRPGYGSQRLTMFDDPTQSLVIKKRVLVSGDMLIDSQPGFDRGQPIVSFRFNALGAKRFCDVTRKNLKKPFAIVLDKQVISAPVIQSAICGGSGQISGSFTVKEANDLSLLLRAGALPAPLEVVEERSVGPTLGSDSVSSGKMAAVYALLFVCILMVAAYGLFGWFANIALVLNIVFIFAILSILQATLTLPGIAGIILTIGIAVDANVLIYERIREELKNGRSVLSAVDTGYKFAKDTIVDANLTTLIVALILFSFGTGPVKGFAVTMSTGIITTLFSALMLTRLIVVGWLRWRKPTTLNI